MNHFYIDSMLKEKRRDMLEEASHLRLISSYNKSAHNRKNYYMSKLGGILIKSGEWLVKKSKGLEVSHSC